MRRRRTISRRQSAITPAAIEAWRRVVALEDATEACARKREAVETKWKRLPNGHMVIEKRGDSDEYRKHLMPCGDSCACMEKFEADETVRRELRIKPHEEGTDLYEELDRLVTESNGG